MEEYKLKKKMITENNNRETKYKFVLSKKMKMISDRKVQKSNITAVQLINAAGRVWL